MSNDDKHQDAELIQYQSEFDTIVKSRQNFLKKERALERVMPPLLTASVFTTSIFLGAWQHIPEQVRPVALAAFALNFSLSPFFKPRSKFPYIARRQTGPVNVSFLEASNSIDREVGRKSEMPLRDFYNEPQGFHSDSSKALWEASKKVVGSKWLEQVKRTSLEVKKTCEKYYSPSSPRAYVHGAVMAAAFVSAVQFHSDFKENWDVVTDWTPPLAPIDYSTTIKPPEKIVGTLVFTDSMIKEKINTDKVLRPHDQSNLTITTYNRPVEVLVNNQPVDSQFAENDGQYSYEVLLTSDTRSVQFEDITFKFDIKEDINPKVSIRHAVPDSQNPGTLRLVYEIADDYGANETSAQIGFSNNAGQIKTPVLEGAKFPELRIPSN